MGNWFARGHAFLGNKIAGVLSLVVPGLGQLLQVRLWNALKFFGIAFIAWLFAANPILLVGPLMLHLWAAADALFHSPLEKEPEKTPAEEARAS